MKAPTGIGKLLRAHRYDEAHKLLVRAAVAARDREAAQTRRNLATVLGVHETTLSRWVRALEERGFGTSASLDEVLNRLDDADPITAAG
jgi:transposase-like protein